MKMILYHLCFFQLIVSPCFSATVKWDCFELWRGDDATYGNNTYELHYYGPHTPEITFTVDSSGYVSPHNDLINEGSPFAYWIVANAGDVITMENVLSKPAFDDMRFTGDEWRVSDFWVETDKELYFAILAGKTNTLYCWVSFIIDPYDGKFNLLHSAISNEPGLVVGQMPEPEPTAGTLAALGLAALLLRRRFGR